MLLCLLLAAGLTTAALADEAETEMVPVLAQVPAGWENPCCWAWADDGTNAFAAWPGGAMEPLGESGWYYIYVPGLRAERHNQRQRGSGADRRRRG